jgi:protein SCO1/2
MNFVIKIAVVLMFTALLACNKSSNQPTVQQSSAQTSSSSKRYHLKGKAVSIEKQAKMVNVDSEAIPGFMDAMTMPYQVKPESELDRLAPGDEITADVVVQDDNGWLENIVVTRHAGAAKKGK